MAPFHGSGYTNSASSMAQNQGPSGMSNTMPTVVTPEGLEIAGRCVESMLTIDAQFPSLWEKLRIGKYFNIRRMNVQASGH